MRPADKLHVTAATVLPLIGRARSKQDAINCGHGAQYLFRSRPAGAQMGLWSAIPMVCTDIILSVPCSATIEEINSCTTRTEDSWLQTGSVLQCRSLQGGGMFSQVTIASLVLLLEEQHCA